MNTQVEQEPAKKQVAKHSLLDAAGAVVEEFETATGIRYQDIASGKTFDYQLKPGSDGMRMLALFGARTLSTNEASAVRNGKDAGGSDEQLAAIEDRFSGIDSGQWVDKTREGGVRIDKAILADAVIEVLTKAGKLTADGAAAAKTKLVAKYESDPKAVTVARDVPGVTEAYKRLTGKTSRSVDDLSAMLG